MVYDPSIPQPDDDPNTKSQADLLENFTQLNAQFGIDHITFNNGVAADEGEHTKISLNDVQADPGLAFPKSSIYTKHVGAAPDRFTSLYFEADPENAATTDIPFQLNLIKAWAQFPANGGIGVIVANDSYNVKSINRDNGSQITISFTTDMGNTNYGVLLTGSEGAASLTYRNGTLVVGSFSIVAPSVALITVVIIGT